MAVQRLTFRLAPLAAVAAIWMGAGSLGAAQSAPQTAEEVVTKNIEAKGGVAKLMAVTSMKRTSTVSMMNMEMQLVVYNKRPNLVRQEITHTGQLIVSGFDGQTPWILNPLLGPPPARPMILSGPQAEQIKADSSFDGPLVNYRNQGSTLALAVSEDQALKQYLYLRLTAKNGQITHIYLDPKTYLEVKQTMVLPQARLETQFEDYRSVDGFTIPFVMRNLVNGVQQNEFKLQKIEFNPALDEALFRVPK